MAEQKPARKPTGMNPATATIVNEEALRQSRANALSLAVETVKGAKNFTNFQVVHTAALYQNYIWDGTTPPVATQAPVEVQGETAADAQV